jgi:type IV pilus assembly protein PilA
MFESVEEITTSKREHPAVSKGAAALGATSAAAVLLIALVQGNWDFGHFGLVGAIFLLLALFAGLLGIVGLFLRGKKVLALVAILTGFGPWALPATLFFGGRSVKVHANEVSAITSLRTIFSAETQYEASYPEKGFACSLSVLGGDPHSGPPSPSSAELLEADLAAGNKSGYAFKITACSKGNNSDTDQITNFEIVAVPAVVGKSGIRGFCVDSTGVLKSDPAGGINCIDPVP